MDAPATGSHGAARVGRVVTGGQSGVDRAALDVALAFGVAYGGFVPRDGWAEDAAVPPGVLAAYPSLTATTSADPAVRTVANVAACDAVLVLRVGGAPSPGTDLTVREASELGRPCLEVDLGQPDAQRLAGFLEALPPGGVLLVAGPRESEDPGIGAAAYSFLTDVAPSLFGGGPPAADDDG
jgi:hypothetical protein